MSVSVRTRFEVFKRDRFTCSYCGKTPPAVLLEVDHIHPIAAGGTDAVENLTTSCQDCNRGKSANLLTEGSVPALRRSEVDDLAERVAQAEAYAGLMQRFRALEDDQYDQFVAAWARAFRADLREGDGGSFYRLSYAWEQWPREASVRAILRRLPLHEVLDAVDIAASWAEREFEGRSYDRTCRYFYGVCYTRIRKAEGR